MPPLNPSHFLPPMSIRPRRILVDMPIHVKEAIVNHADIKTRISLRRCNHELLHLVDTLPIVYDKIKLYKKTVRDYMEAKDDEKWGMTVTKGAVKTFPDPHRNSTVEENQEWLLKGLEAILKNPNAKIVHLDTSNFDLLKLHPILSSLSHKLSVKELRISSLDQNNVLSLLPYLKPEVLESFKGGEVSSDCLPNLLHLPPPPKRRNWNDGIDRRRRPDACRIRIEDGKRVQKMVHLENTQLRYTNSATI